MRLSLNGNSFVIGQLGPDFVILRDAKDHPPSRGEITVSIDGRERRWSVDLPEGIVVGKPETRIVS